MERFTTLAAIAAPYYFPDINTDQIIPHRFLRKPLSAGYGNFLFHDVRYTADGRERPDFVLNRQPYRNARILIAGPNVGGGSARDPAVYALLDFGFRAMIAPSYADTFRAICLQNGFLPVELPESVVENLGRYVTDHPHAVVAIDLERQTVAAPDGASHAFEIEPSRKQQFLLGTDDIGVTLQQIARIEAFEADHHALLPWFAPVSKSLE